MNIVIKCERCGKIITKSGDKNAEGEQIDDFYDLEQNCNTICYHGKRVCKETETGNIACVYADRGDLFLCDKCYQEFKNFLGFKKEN